MSVAKRSMFRVRAGYLDPNPQLGLPNGGSALDQLRFGGLLFMGSNSKVQQDHEYDKKMHPSSPPFDGIFM